MERVGSRNVGREIEREREYMYDPPVHGPASSAWASAEWGARTAAHGGMEMRIPRRRFRESSTSN